MDNELFAEVKQKLNTHPGRLTDLNQWLLVTVNTAKAIIINSDRSKLAYLAKIFACRTTAEMQHYFDTVQGKFGTEAFFFRYQANYRYLSLLVAQFSNRELSPKEQHLLKDFSKIDQYFLYQI